VTPAPDVEQPAAWCYDRSLFAEPAIKALCLVVLTRLQCDDQTRNERVVLVLRAKRTICKPSFEVLCLHLLMPNIPGVCG